MNEDALRAMVREAIDRHLVRRADADEAPPRLAAEPSAPSRSAAFALCVVPAGGDTGDGACLIEPSVACTHCGFCRSLGH